jgi:hypothetical protein
MHAALAAWQLHHCRASIQIFLAHHIAACVRSIDCCTYYSKLTSCVLSYVLYMMIGMLFVSAKIAANAYIPRAPLVIWVSFLFSKVMRWESVSHRAMQLYF